MNVDFYVYISNTEDVSHFLQTHCNLESSLLDRETISLLGVLSAVLSVPFVSIDRDRLPIINEGQS